RTYEVANRLEAGQWMVVHLSQLRIDDKWNCRHEDGITIRRSACDRFDSDHLAGPRAVLDHHRRPLRTPDLLRQQARQEVEDATWCARNDDFDRSRRLGPCSLAGHAARENT